MSAARNRTFGVPAVSIIAICPYCRVGGVRAPTRAVGLSATCPKCQASYTITPTEGQSDTGPVRPKPRRPAAETAPAAALPTESAEPLPAPPPITPRAGGPALVVALVAVTLGGLGLTASQLPAGRFAAVAAVGAGLLLGAVSLLLPGRSRGVPALSAGLNAAVLAVLFAAPDWLGLGSWQPLPEEPPTVMAVAIGGGPEVPVEWVEAGTANWVRDDVRVAVVGVRVTPLELVGPKNQKRKTRDSLLQIRLRVANVGVARPFEFAGWSADGVKLTDPAGKPVTARMFSDPSWKPDRPKHPTTLYPGKSSDDLLVFAAPPAGDQLRLELPGAAVGSPDPVRFVIPRSAFPPK